MIISRLQLENFRNYKDLDINFSENLNVIHGNNGLGKTNILEALFLCASGKSHRTNKDIELINYEKKNFTVTIAIEKDISSDIQIIYNRDRQKIIKVNGLCVRKTGQLLGNLLAVLFSPEDMMLINEGPSQRRKFIDIAISQLKPSYYFDLQQYNKIVSQKNALLREVKRNPKNKETIEVWNANIVEYGSKIIYARINFIKKLAEIAKEKHMYITDQKECLNIEYINSFEINDILSITEIEDIKFEFSNILVKYLSKELEREQCLFGPHRDEVNFILDGTDLKKYGSQGQKRTAILASKISELEIMLSQTGRTPILLLDDVLSELDKDRQFKLLKYASTVQTFITSVDSIELKNNEISSLCNFSFLNSKLYKQED